MEFKVIYHLPLSTQTVSADAVPSSNSLGSMHSSERNTFPPFLSAPKRNQHCWLSTKQNHQLITKQSSSPTIWPKSRSAPIPSRKKVLIFHSMLSFCTKMVITTTKQPCALTRVLSRKLRSAPIPKRKKVIDSIRILSLLSTRSEFHAQLPIERKVEICRCGMAAKCKSCQIRLPCLITNHYCLLVIV